MTTRPTRRVKVLRRAARPTVRASLETLLILAGLSVLTLAYQPALRAQAASALHDTPLQALAR